MWSSWKSNLIAGLEFIFPLTVLLKERRSRGNFNGLDSSPGLYSKFLSPLHHRCHLFVVALKALQDENHLSQIKGWCNFTHQTCSQACRVLLLMKKRKCRIKPFVAPEEAACSLIKFNPNCLQWYYSQCLSCIVYNVGGMFWKGRRISADHLLLTCP